MTSSTGTRMAEASGFSVLRSAASCGFLESLEFVVKRTACDPEAAGSAFDRATFVLQHEIDVGALHLLQSSAAGDLRLRVNIGTLELKLMHGQVVAFRQQYRPLQNIAQLTNIAGPGILLKGIHCRFLER